MVRGKVTVVASMLYTSVKSLWCDTAAYLPRIVIVTYNRWFSCHRGDITLLYGKESYYLYWG